MRRRKRGRFAHLVDSKWCLSLAYPCAEKSPKIELVGRHEKVKEHTEPISIGDYWVLRKVPVLVLEFGPEDLPLIDRINVLINPTHVRETCSVTVAKDLPQKGLGNTFGKRIE